MRIVSLLPSATEIICALGLADQLVGVTHECDFPPAILGRPIVTRSLIRSDASSAEIDLQVSQLANQTVAQRASDRMALYALDPPTLFKLRPDLIVTQALCNVCAVDETEVRRAAASMPWQPKVINLQPTSLAGLFQAIQKVADAAGVAGRGVEKVRLLNNRVATIVEKTTNLDVRPSVIFLEWLDPLFCSGHWNPELIELAGGRECIGRKGARSRRIDLNDILREDPEVLFIACCGYSAQQALADLDALRQQPGWAELKAVRNGRIFVTDGSAYFNRPGPRLVESLEILSDALHPESSPRGAVWRFCQSAQCKIMTAPEPLDPDGALSREYLLSRGSCCGNGCRNCPYGERDGKREVEKTERQGFEPW